MISRNINVKKNVLFFKCKANNIKRLYQTNEARLEHQNIQRQT